MKEIKKRSLCPISSALDIIGDKWSLLIIRDIVFEGKKTYGEFAKSEERMASNILADRLSMLEWVVILTKEDNPENKKVPVYYLTQKGADLIPVMAEMILWSDKYNEISEQAKQFAQMLKQNKEQIIEGMKAQVKRAT